MSDMSAKVREALDIAVPLIFGRLTARDYEKFADTHVDVLMDLVALS